LRNLRARPSVSAPAREVKMIKILVVEDEKATADMITAFLKRKGFEVDTAYDLLSAMEKPLADYDIVLLDIILKDTKSFPLLKKIKEEDPRTAVIMVSAYDNDVNIAEAKKLGADWFIVKPMMAEYLESFLITKIHSLCKKK
jgi:two-component system response regulator HydG